MITDAELSEIEARAANATRGPWSHYRDRLRPDSGPIINEVRAPRLPAVVKWNGFDDSDRSKRSHAKNAEFIAAARDDVPRLIEEVRHLRALVAGHEECAASSRRLAREIDVAMHGEAGAARKASLCDLVDPARWLREENERLRAALADHQLHTTGVEDHDAPVRETQAGESP